MGRLTINGIEKLNARYLPKADNSSEDWWVVDVSNPNPNTEFDYVLDVTNGDIITYITIERMVVGRYVVIQLANKKTLYLYWDQLIDGPEYLLRTLHSELCDSYAINN